MSPVDVFIIRRTLRDERVIYIYIYLMTNFIIYGIRSIRSTKKNYIRTYNKRKMKLSF